MHNDLEQEKTWGHKPIISTIFFGEMEDILEIGSG